MSKMVLCFDWIYRYDMCLNVRKICLNHIKEMEPLDVVFETFIIFPRKWQILLWNDCG